MKLAINYSQQASQLLAEGHIDIDLFKCPDWQGMISQALIQRPVAVHFTLTAGNGTLKSTDWEVVSQLLEKTGTPYVNLHLESSVQDFPGIPPDTIDPIHYQQIRNNLLEDVSLAVTLFGSDRVIIENVPYRGVEGNVLRPSVEPELINSIHGETGCGLLLDISHARIAARTLGVNEQTYMAQLPVVALKELHFTGLHQRKRHLQDHLEILESDWPVLDWVLERIHLGEWARPWMLAFEYGGVGEKYAWRCDPLVIEKQVPLLYERVIKI
jgi:uncharacterized protein (UPF0276 family)